MSTGPKIDPLPAIGAALMVLLFAAVLIVAGWGVVLLFKALIAAPHAAVICSTADPNGLGR